MTTEQHLDNLVRHIRLVQDACLLLGRRLIERGEAQLGLALVARGFVHDNSKFFGIEWDYLHAGRDVPAEALKLAVRHHTLSNDHHPEFWGGVEKMPEIAIAEMVCDWYSRSQEFGTGLREWVTRQAAPKFGISPDGEAMRLITKYLDLLLEKPFDPLRT